MDLGNGLGHLTYSTLVHPGDTWDDMWTSLTTYVPQVQKRVCPTAPFGVSLRLSNASASTLVKSKPERFCFLETTDETVDYFTNHLYTGKSAEMLAKLASIPVSESIIAQREFI